MRACRLCDFDACGFVVGSPTRRAHIGDRYPAPPGFGTSCRGQPRPDKVGNLFNPIAPPGAILQLSRGCQRQPIEFLGLGEILGDNTKVANAECLAGHWSVKDVARRPSLVGENPFVGWPPQRIPLDHAQSVVLERPRSFALLVQPATHDRRYSSRRRKGRGHFDKYFCSADNGRSIG